MGLWWEMSEEQKEKLKKKREMEREMRSHEKTHYDTWERVSDNINYQRPPPRVQRNNGRAASYTVYDPTWRSDDDKNVPSTSGPRPNPIDSWGAPEASESPEPTNSQNVQDWGTVEDEEEEEATSYRSSDSPYRFDEDEDESEVPDAPEDAPGAEEIVIWGDCESYRSSDSPYKLDEDEDEAPENGPEDDSEAERKMKEIASWGTVGDQDSDSYRSSDSPYKFDEDEDEAPENDFNVPEAHKEVVKNTKNSQKPVEKNRFNNWGTTDKISEKLEEKSEILEKEVSSSPEVRRFNIYNTLTPKKDPQNSSESYEPSENVRRFQNYQTPSKNGRESEKYDSEAGQNSEIKTERFKNFEKRKSGNSAGGDSEAPKAPEIKTPRFQNFGACSRDTVAPKKKSSSPPEDDKAPEVHTSRFRNYEPSPKNSKPESSSSPSSDSEDESEISNNSSVPSEVSGDDSEALKAPEVEKPRFQNFGARPRDTVVPKEKSNSDSEDNSRAPEIQTSRFRNYGSTVAEKENPDYDSDDSIAPAKPPTSLFRKSPSPEKVTVARKSYNPYSDLDNEGNSSFGNSIDFSKKSKGTVVSEPPPKEETSIFDTLSTIRFDDVVPFKFSKDTTAKDTVAKVEIGQVDCEKLARQLLNHRNPAHVSEVPVTLKSVRDSIKQKKKLKPYEGAEPQNICLPSTSQNPNVYRAKLSNRVSPPKSQKSSKKGPESYNEFFEKGPVMDVSGWVKEDPPATKYFSAYGYEYIKKPIEIKKMTHWNNNQYKDPENAASRSEDTKSAREEKEDRLSPTSSLASQLQKQNDKLAQKKVDEFTDNKFSIFYQRTKKSMKKPTSAKKSIIQYTHEMAVEFAAASWYFTGKAGDPLERVPGTMDIPSYVDQDGCKAYYRLIADKEEKYILMAVHVNVHGFHRGDLRFVEVNDTTCLKGLEGKSCIGQLFLGDILAVTELARTGNYHQYRTNIKCLNQETPCTWQVKSMSLLERNLEFKLKFSFLSNHMAIAKGFDEAMDVRGKVGEVDKLFVGNAFLPLKMESVYCEGYDKKMRNRLAIMASNIPSYPNPIGTIFEFQEDLEANRVFNIGTDAFKNSEEDGTDNLSVRKEKIVETCVLMGYSAANSIFNGRFDCRAFPLQNARREGLYLQFYIANPSSQPTLGRWNTNNKLNITGPSMEVSATIESVVESSRHLKITARLARGTPYHLDFTSQGHVVYQREPPENNVLCDDFFVIMPRSCNARRIIEVLYGAEPLKMCRDYPKGCYSFPGDPVIGLNEFQNDYVSMILAGTPMVLGSSPFGCGKSMTIVTAAFEVHKRNCELYPLQNQRQQLLITQSNYASVNLIEIAKKAMDPEVKFVRYVSDKCWKDLPDGSRTDYDMPVLMEKLFSDWARGTLEPRIQKRCKNLNNVNFHNILFYLLDNKIIQPFEIKGTADAIYKKMPELRKANQQKCLEAFFVLYQPDIIMVTADSSLSLLHLRVLKDVITIQIDEASQLPEYTLFGLLVSFPNANFGLIGDIHQLPPYCAEELTGKLKAYGIGNTMERAVKGSLFPKAVLRYVYRCHPVTTRLLSDLFYEGDLISGVTEDMRNEFMLQLPRSFWPNPNYPMIIVNNQEHGYRSGTSCGNRAEIVLARQIVRFITRRSGYCIPAKDVGVISFYSAQTNQLNEELRGSGVKCGTVDSFQGSEREVIILCLTNERLTDFMQLSNRLNVAMSRARQATIVIGNVDGMKMAKYWSTVVQRAAEHGCIVDTNSEPFLLRY